MPGVRLDRFRVAAACVLPNVILEPLHDEVAQQRVILFVSRRLAAQPRVP